MTKVPSPDGNRRISADDHVTPPADPGQTSADPATSSVNRLPKTAAVRVDSQVDDGDDLPLPVHEALAAARTGNLARTVEIALGSVGQAGLAAELADSSALLGLVSNATQSIRLHLAGQAPEDLCRALLDAAMGRGVDVNLTIDAPNKLASTDQLRALELLSLAGIPVRVANANKGATLGVFDAQTLWLTDNEPSGPSSAIVEHEPELAQACSEQFLRAFDAAENSSLAGYVSRAGHAARHSLVDQLNTKPGGSAQPPAHAIWETFSTVLVEVADATNAMALAESTEAAEIAERKAYMDLHSEVRHVVTETRDLPNNATRLVSEEIHAELARRLAPPTGGVHV